MSSAADLNKEFKEAEDKRVAVQSHAEKLAALRSKRLEIRASIVANATTTAAKPAEAKPADDQAAVDEQPAEAKPADDKPAEEEKPVEEVKPVEDDHPVTKYANFVEQRGALYARLEGIRAAFEYGAGIEESDLRAASLRSVFAACDEWLKDGFATTAEADIAALGETGAAMEAEGADVHSVEVLTEKADACKKLYAAHSRTWHRESTRRSSREKMLAEFDEDRTKLLQWCRQQVSMLSNLAEPDHVQEFCASFYNNTAVMESNFLVLMEMSEAFLPDADVEKQLMELAEVWLGLETQAYEKLRATLLDLHAKSGIEAQARQWPELADRFTKFLADSSRVLSIPSDEESVAVAAPLKESCKELQANAEPHRLIVAHLSDFSLREECIKEHYNAIHKAAFSKLTLLTQAFPGLYTYPRKREYTDRMAELADWVEAKSRGQAWKDLLHRVERMKRLIEDNELALNSNEERA